MVWILGLLAAVAAGADTDLQTLRHRNESLRVWLQLARSDSTYLIVDRQAGELRLSHGRAVLRRCPIVTDNLGQRPPMSLRLAAHLRSYRASNPWEVPIAGPFDWEHNLVEEATPRSAIYFDKGLVVYAAPQWRRPSGLGLELGEKDLRALFNSCADGTPMVVLPVGWKESP